MLSRLFYRLILLTLVGMLVAPFVLKRENGTPIMSLDEFLSFDTGLIQERYTSAMAMLRGFLGLEAGAGAPTSGGVTRFYKWQDEKGEWHFSDKNSEKYQVEEVEIEHDRNILNFGDLNNNPDELEQGIPVVNQPDSLPSSSSGNPSSGKSNSGKPNSGPSGARSDKGYFNRITGTLEDAKQVQSIVDENYARKVKELESY